MSTVSISLPSQQISLIDKLITSHGFTNRSEFFRSLVRLVTKREDLVADAATYPFVSP